MAQASILVREYNGALLAANLLSAQRTIVLGDFGPAENGLLVDNDGTLGSTDNGTSTFEGQAVTYIGSGTVQPGVSVLGVTVPLGASKPVVVFSAGGQIYFAFPEGQVNLVGAVALVVNISGVPGNVFTPVCFAKGTLIRTPYGDRRIETLEAGDMVLSAAGSQHEIVWIGSRRLTIPLGLDRAFEKWLPVCIEAGAMGRGMPYSDLYVSQQHRIQLDGPSVELMFGETQMLAPAKALLGDRVYLDRSVREITYFHILCDKHVILLANGLPAESLLPGPMAQDGLGTEAWEEFADLFPAWSVEVMAAQRPALPLLKLREAAVVMRSLARAE